MKNKFALITIVIMTLCIVFTAVSCKETLAAPSDLDMSGSVLSWKAVEGAESYEIDVKGVGTYETTRTTFTVEVPSTGTYEIKVRARKGELYSEYSPVYTYVVAKMLEKPVVSYDEITKTVSWNAVEGAEKYSVRVRRSDKDISADGAIIEITEVADLSYVLTKEEYTKTGGFIIEVKALAGSNSESSDSPYSEPVNFVNSAQLSIPTVTSITTTRIYWNSVANATSYYLVATNKESGKQYTQTIKASSSTSVSAQLSGFNIEETGEYYVQIKTVGDGNIYSDSELSTQSDEYVIYKLAQMAEDSVTLIPGEDGLTKVQWKLTKEEHKLVQTFTIVLTPYRSDGDAVLSSQRAVIDLQSESDKSKYTVTEDENGYTYTYVLDQLFTSKSEDGTINYILNDVYYGKRFDVTVSSSRSGNGVLAGDEVKAADKYLSYKTPQKQDGNYLISSAAELAYILKEPNATYVQTADIDFEDYEWLTVDEFGGTYEGGNFVISNMSIIPGKTSNVGFFGKITANGKVRGLKLLNVTLETEEGVVCGIVAGINEGEITNCIAYGSIKAEYATAGGLTGINYGSIYTSQTAVDVNAAVAGGFVAINGKQGEEGGVIMFSNSRGDVTADLKKTEEEKKLYTADTVYAGGFVAVNYGTVASSSAIGNVVSKSEIALASPNYAGGFVAANHGTVTLCYAGANYSEDYSKRTNVTASGVNQGISAGGFVGINEGNISESYANVKATSTKYVGGFAGVNKGQITNAFSIGGVTVGSTTEREGGFVGFNDQGATVTNVYYYDETMGDSETRPDNDIAQFVAKDDMGATLAGKLGENFGVIGGTKNTVLKDMLYVDKTEVSISPSQEFSVSAKYVAKDGTEKEILANNTQGEGYSINGSTATEGLATLVFTNGSYRGLTIITIG